MWTTAVGLPLFSAPSISSSIAFEPGRFVVGLRLRSRRAERTSAFTRALISRRSNGLDMYASAPASRPWTWSSVDASAVSIRIGVRDHITSALSRRATSRPSTRGIITSRTNRSGSCALTSFSASSPSRARKQRKPASPSAMLTMCAMASSSSAITIFLRSIGDTRVIPLI